MRARNSLMHGRRLLEEAEAVHDAGDVDRAATLLVQAVEQLATGPAALHSEAYLRLAVVNRRRRRTAAALHCLRKALSLTPESMVAHHELIELHAEWDEWDRVLDAEEALLAVTSADERVRELLRSGDRWWRRAGDRARARRRYEDALLLDGKCLQAKARLRAIEQQREQREQLRTDLDSVRFSADPAERARRWLDIAQRQWFSLRSESEAIDALERAFEEDPGLHEAVELWVEILVQRHRWAALESLWARVADATSPDEIEARHIVMRGLRSTPPPPSSARMPGQERRRRRTNPWFDQADPASAACVEAGLSGRERPMPVRSDVYELLEKASDAPPPISHEPSVRTSHIPVSGVRDHRGEPFSDDREDHG